MKPADPSAFKRRAKTDFDPLSAVPAEELFLPSVIEVVKHLARVAAESDYLHFLDTGEIRYSSPDPEIDDD